MDKDIEYFDKLWETLKPNDGMQHNKETWDRLAEHWKDDPKDVEEIKNKQYIELTNYLTERGALTKDTEVIDIGCGSGGYAIEFAKRAKRVTCLDVSPKMLEYCKESAVENELLNIDFLECDFLNEDIANWDNKYDFVFTSLSPAMDGLQSIEKVNKMTRKWCFNNSFVYRKDNLRNAVKENVYNQPISNNWGNSSTYCLFNILWHMGYKPEIRYYKEVISHTYDFNMELCHSVTTNIIRDRAPTDEEVKMTYNYLKTNMVKDGKITKVTDSLYAWTLWNVEE